MSPSLAPLDLVGSAAWTNADMYEEEGEFQVRASKFLRDTNWENLIRVCSQTCHGISCRLEERFSIGHFNMVRQVVFEDGVTWIARLRMPALADEKPIPNLVQSLSSEVACMRFLKQNSSVPVPEVYHYDLTPNDVGSPYILMEYIHGSVASELWNKVGTSPYQYGTPEQDKAFRRSMAAIQVELSSITFDRIGSLYQNPKTLDFYIGPDAESGFGPWKSSLDYYHFIAQQKKKYCVQNASREVLGDASMLLPNVFEYLMKTSIEERSPQGPFGLVHTDLGAHNLLVDEDFKILAVIDFDGLMAAPIEIQAQFPMFTGLQMEIPFEEPRNEFAKARIERTRPKLAEYKGMVQEIEKQRRLTLNRSILPGDIMLSDIAHVVFGFQDYDQHDLGMNQRWMHAYRGLLSKSFKSAHNPGMRGTQEFDVFDALIGHKNNDMVSESSSDGVREQVTDDEGEPIMGSVN